MKPHPRPALKATRSLPRNYVPANRLEIANWRLALPLNLLGVPLLLVFGWLFLQAAAFIRSEILSPKLSDLFEKADLLNLLIALLVVLVLHELIHGLFFRLFTGDRPVLGAHWLYAYAAAPGWYLPRRQFTVVGLAPIVLISLLGLVFLRVGPFAFTPAIFLALTVNAAASVGDLLIVAWLARYGPEVLVQDSGPVIEWYRPVPGDLAGLYARWTDLTASLTADRALAGELFLDLVRRYREGGRSYHTLQHVELILELVSELRDVVEDHEAVQLAAWYHDAVYDPRAADNEIQSAAYARASLSRLGLAAELQERVASLILATDIRQTARADGDTYVLLDADLATLAADEADYDSYSQQIRQEYHWVPEVEYRQARAQILRGFLERERIFQTERFHERYERRARENVRRELESLEG